MLTDTNRFFPYIGSLIDGFVNVICVIYELVILNGILKSKMPFAMECNCLDKKHFSTKINIVFLKYTLVFRTGWKMILCPYFDHIVTIVSIWIKKPELEEEDSILAFEKRQKWGNQCDVHLMHKGLHNVINNVQKRILITFCKLSFLNNSSLIIRNIWSIFQGWFEKKPDFDFANK